MSEIEINGWTKSRLKQRLQMLKDKHQEIEAAIQRNKEANLYGPIPAWQREQAEIRKQIESVNKQIKEIEKLENK